jgi:hypothetical protein
MRRTFLLFTAAILLAAAAGCGGGGNGKEDSDVDLPDLSDDGDGPADPDADTPPENEDDQADTPDGEDEGVEDGADGTDGEEDIVDVPDTEEPGPGELIFASGWENAATGGCDIGPLTDDLAWTSYGPPDICAHPCNGGNAVAEVFATGCREGSRCLRVIMPPNAACDVSGPHVRILKTLPAPQAELFVRWYIRWSDNWVWSSGSANMMVLGTSGTSGTQTLFVSVRGNDDDTTGRVAIRDAVTDEIYSDPDVTVTRGAWHRVEVHVVTGTAGRLEARLDGVTLDLLSADGDPAGTPPEGIDTGSEVGFILLDAAYESYLYLVSNGEETSALYDSVAVHGPGGWIGDL